MASGVACLDRERDERDDVLEPFELVHERFRVFERKQRWRRDSSERHQLVEVDSTSDVWMTYKLMIYI